MKKQIIIPSMLIVSLVLATIAIGLPVNAFAQCTTEVSGNITQNTTWTKTGSPYCVTTDITVANAASLVIKPGVVVRFLDNYYLKVDGALWAKGTETEPVTFTTNHQPPKPGDWQGISLGHMARANDCLLKNCLISYAKVGISLNEADVRIDSCKIAQCSEYGIEVWDCSSTITGNSITENSWTYGGGGIRVTYGSPTIIGNFVSRNSGYFGGGIGVSLSSPLISANTVVGNSGVYGGGIFVSNSFPTIIGNNISRNSGIHGGALRIYNSDPVLRGNTITENKANWGGGLKVDNDSSYSAIIDRNFIYGNVSEEGACFFENGNSQMRFNDLDCNGATYVSAGPGSPPLNAENNWWGTANEDSIKLRIKDWYDDHSLGVVDYTPFSLAPNLVPPVTITFSDTPDSAFRGNPITWKRRLANNTATIQRVDWWLKIRGPVNRNILGMADRVLAPHEEGTLTVKLKVPTKTPLGEYTITGCVGNFETKCKWDSDSFVCKVTSSPLP